MMMYPLARSFGGMKQSEIKTNRAAFVVLQKEGLEKEAVVFPALVIDLGQPSWDAAAGQRLVEILSAEHGLKATPAGQEPGVPYTPMPANQLRYHNERAGAYAAWVRLQPKPAEYSWFMEIFMDVEGGQIHAMHLYVVDAAGNIPFCQLTNSHHYGPQPPATVEEGIQFLVRRFFKELEEPAEEAWPAYGVG